MAQITVRLSDELLKQVNLACGDVPRERWVRRTLEQALAAKPGGQAVSTAQGRSSEIQPVGAGSTPAEPVAKAGVRDAAPAPGPAPARASSAALDRQALLNKAKGL